MSTPLNLCILYFNIILHVIGRDCKLLFGIPSKMFYLLYRLSWVGNIPKTPESGFVLSLELKGFSIKDQALQIMPPI
ncbi:hypothetical protein ABIE66_000689 [Peribacillus sp. B2I2]